MRALRAAGTLMALVAVVVAPAIVGAEPLRQAGASKRSEAAVMAAVSCSSQSDCTAVGYTSPNPSTTASLAERWNGSRWTLQSAANPKPSKTNGMVQLDGVSCPSAHECLAVGSYDDTGGTQLTLAERWDGKRWSLEKTPNPTGGGALAAVSCASASSCTAVGSSVSGIDFVTLAEHWNGSKWSIQTSPNPSAPGGGSLSTGVSCASAKSCIAVGYSFTTPETQAPLAERWNGKKWSIHNPSSPAEATSTQLAGVSCPTASSCTAVGWYDTSVRTLTLAEHWDGSGWTIETTRNAGGGGNSQLLGVSCTSPRSCAAAGESRPPSGTALTLAERWTGSSWKLEKSPNPKGYELVSLAGVACVSTQACSAVGSKARSELNAKYQTLAESWNGRQWTLQRMPKP